MTARSTSVALAEVAEFTNGLAFKPSDWTEDGSRIIRIQNLTDPQKPYNRTRRDVADRYRVHPGDILVSWSATLGVFEWRADDVAVLNQHIFRVEPDDEVVNRGYLRHVLAGALRDMERHLHGATMRHVNRAEFLATRIPLPSLAEQRRIADILDRLDRLRAQRRAAITQLDSLSRSIFLEMFEDPSSNPYGWAVHKIADVVRDFRGGASLAPDDFVATGFPVLHKGAIKKHGKIALDPKKKTFARDAYAAANQRSQVDRSFAVVTLRDLVPTGPTIGLVADLRHGPSNRYLLAQGVYGFHVDEHAVVSEYLVALSNMPTFRHVLRRNAVGSTQIHIRTPVYLNIEIPTPPLANQLEFARRVTGLKQIGRTQSGSLDELDALFASVQYQAFNGAL